MPTTEWIEAARDVVRQMCRERHITITPHGNAYRLRGVGVDRVVSNLEGVSARDLRPMVRKGYVDELDEPDDFYEAEVDLFMKYRNDDMAW